MSVRDGESPSPMTALPRGHVWHACISGWSWWARTPVTQWHDRDALVALRPNRASAHHRTGDV